MAEYSANAYQIIAPGQSAILTSSFLQPYECRYMLHRDDTPGVLLRGATPGRYMCCCCADQYAEYYALFSANVNIPEGGTLGEIAVSLAVNGETIPLSQMLTTPGAVEEFDNISAQLAIPIPRWCCQSVTIDNNSENEIGMQNANLTILLPGMVR